MKKNKKVLEDLQVCDRCGSSQVARCKWVNVNDNTIYSEDSGTTLEWCFGDCKCETNIVEAAGVFFCRKCSITGKGMNEGYCFGDGEEYAASKNDALKIAQRLGFKTLQAAYYAGAYHWTDWEQDYQYKVVGGELVELIEQD